MMEELSEREKRVYLAGYIDSDGSIGIGQQPSAGRKAYRLRLDISSTNGDIIKWLTESYNGQITNGSNSPSTCKPLKQWRLYDRNAYKLIHDVRPYLLLKDRQAELAMGFYQDCIRRKQKGKLRPKWLISREEAYHAQMHVLNARGKTNCSSVSSVSEQGDKRELNEMEKMIYLGAVLDAEGAITIYHASQPSKNYYGYLLQVEVGNTDFRLIGWLKSIFNGNVSLRTNDDENWRTVGIWRVWGPRAYRLLKQVRPFLIVKPKQADLAIEFYRKCVTNTGKRPQWRKDKAYEYYMQMKKLNKRGVSNDSEEEQSSDNFSQPDQVSLSSF